MMRQIERLDEIRSSISLHYGMVAFVLVFFIDD